MSIPHSVPANDRLKATFDSWLWSSMIVAAVVHFGTFALWPTLTAVDTSIEPDILTTIALPPDLVLPPAPEELPRPAAPVMATTEISEEITIGLTTFENNPVDELPPPPSEVRTVASSTAFTPFTVAPSILNTDEVVRAMRRVYPATLRDAGIGGTVRVNFFIDERGRVVETRIEEGSGYETLDEAALAVAHTIRFSPALNRDHNVAVWVVFPIVFRVDTRED
jgi:protein TonB